MKENKATDFFIGIGIVVFGIVVFMLSSALPSAPTGLGSRGYPMFLAIWMVVLGLALALPIALKGELKGKLKIQFSGFRDPQAVIKIVVCVATSFLYVFLVARLGFLLLTPIYLFGLMMLFGYRKYILAGVVSILLSVGVFFLFMRVFYVFLPTFRLF